MNTSFNKTVTWVILFAIAMGFMECAVVVYLRELYYKTGFTFPLKTIPAFIGKVETWRELGTIIMLAGMGIIAGKNRLQRFAYFVLAFAIWDLFYYVFLYVCLGWPQSLSTWDILFLIPVPWVGPVWAPCLLCLLMIVGSFHVIKRTQFDKSFSIALFYWWLLFSGAFICIVSFMWDYLSHTTLQAHGSFFSNRDLFSEIENYTPQKFNNILFFTVFFPMLASVIFSMIKESKSIK